uniref:Uncharacterized protein n=1 Tax=Elaeophora elaphi TaxID=1147741 RepID=A0A0R3RQ73_9BILA
MLLMPRLFSRRDHQPGKLPCPSWLSKYSLLLCIFTIPNPISLTYPTGKQLFHLILQ